MNKTHIEVSPDVTSTLLFLRVESKFDGKQRVISKKEASARKISEEVKDRSKTSVSRDIQKLKDTGIIKEKDNNYIIMEPQGSYNSLPTDFVKQMMRMLSGEVINVYNWLYRRYGYCKKINKPCLFSYGDIVEQAMGKYNKDRTRKQAMQALHQLELNGLIARRRVRVGKTFLWWLEAIRTEFVISDLLDQVEEEIIKGQIEFQGDTKALAEEINFEDMEVGAVLGFTDNDLPKLKTSTRGLLMAYKPIEELAEEHHTDNESYLAWLESIGENDEYIAYERDRLNNII